MSAGRLRQARSCSPACGKSSAASSRKIGRTSWSTSSWMSASGSSGSERSISASGSRHAARRARAGAARPRRRVRMAARHRRAEARQRGRGRAPRHARRAPLRLPPATPRRRRQAVGRRLLAQPLELVLDLRRLGRVRRGETGAIAHARDERAQSLDGAREHGQRGPGNGGSRCCSTSSACSSDFAVAAINGNPPVRWMPHSVWLARTIAADGPWCESNCNTSSSCVSVATCCAASSTRMRNSTVESVTSPTTTSSAGATPPLSSGGIASSVISSIGHRCRSSREATTASSGTDGSGRRQGADLGQLEERHRERRRRGGRGRFRGNRIRTRPPKVPRRRSPARGPAAAEEPRAIPASPMREAGVPSVPAMATSRLRPRRSPRAARRRRHYAAGRRELADPRAEAPLRLGDHREHGGRDDAFLLEQAVVDLLDLERDLAQVGEADHPAAALERVELSAHGTQRLAIAVVLVQDRALRATVSSTSLRLREVDVEELRVETPSRRSRAAAASPRRLPVRARRSRFPRSR